MVNLGQQSSEVSQARRLPRADFHEPNATTPSAFELLLQRQQQQQLCRKIVILAGTGVPLFPQEATAPRILELYDERIAIDADALADQDVLLYGSNRRPRVLHEVACIRLEAEMRARTDQRSPYKHERKKRRAGGRTATQPPCIADTPPNSMQPTPKPPPCMVNLGQQISEIAQPRKPKCDSTPQKTTNGKLLVPMSHSPNPGQRRIYPLGKQACPQSHISQLIAPQTAAVSLPEERNSIQTTTNTVTLPSTTDTVESAIESPPSQIAAHTHVLTLPTPTEFEIRLQQQQQQCMEIVQLAKSGAHLFPLSATTNCVMELYDARIDQLKLDKSTLAEHMQYTYDHHILHEEACQLLKTAMEHCTSSNARRQLRRSKKRSSAMMASEGGWLPTSGTTTLPPLPQPLPTLPTTPAPTLTDADIDQILHRQAELCASIEEQEQQQRHLFPPSAPQIDVIRLYDNWAGLLDRRKAPTELAERYQAEPEHCKRIDWAFILLGTQLSARVPRRRITIGRRHLQLHPSTADYKLLTELSVPTNAVPDDEGATSMDTSSDATAQLPGPTTEQAAATPRQQPIVMTLVGAQATPTDCAAGTDTEPVESTHGPAAAMMQLSPSQRQLNPPGYIQRQRQRSQWIIQRKSASEPLFPIDVTSMRNILRLYDAQIAMLSIDESSITPKDQQWVTDDHRELLQEAHNALNFELRQRTTRRAREKYGLDKRKRQNKSGNPNPKQPNININVVNIDLSIARGER
jgi:hypothetical protein